MIIKKYLNHSGYLAKTATFVIPRISIGRSFDCLLLKAENNRLNISNIKEQKHKTGLYELQISRFNKRLQ